MTDKPKRKFWQFHLSTAVLMMFATGGVLLANHREYEFTPGSIMGERNYPKTGSGWPFNIESSQILDFRSAYILFNVGTGVCIVIGLGVASEYLLRRREARKP